jgi:hypothetical protein
VVAVSLHMSCWKGSRVAGGSWANGVVLWTSGCSLVSGICEDTVVVALKLYCTSKGHIKTQLAELYPS